MFARHHYLSHTHHSAAKVFLATVNGQLAGFISVMHFPHPKAKNIKKVHRLVVLPDYQGAGIGIKLMEFVGYLYTKAGYRFSLVTSSPSLYTSLKRNAQWVCKHFGRLNGGGNKGISSANKNSGKRITTSWEFLPDRKLPAGIQVTHHKSQ